RFGGPEHAGEAPAGLATPRRRRAGRAVFWGGFFGGLAVGGLGFVLERGLMEFGPLFVSLALGPALGALLGTLRTGKSNVVGGVLGGGLAGLAVCGLELGFMAADYPGGVAHLGLFLLFLLLFGEIMASALLVVGSASGCLGAWVGKLLLGARQERRVDSDLGRAELAPFPLSHEDTAASAGSRASKGTGVGG